MKIETDQQYRDAVARVEEFIQKGFSNLTDAETSELASLSKDVEEYEDVKYPMPMPDDPC